MAAGSFTLYSNAVTAAAQGSFNFGSDNYNVILLTTAYTPSPNSDTLYSDISASEVAAGGGYTVGGQTMTGVTWVRNTGTSTFSAQSVAWPGSTISARYAAIVRRGGVTLAPGDRLLGFVDLSGGGSVSTTAATFQINWNNSSTPSSAAPIFNVSHSP